MEKQLQGWALRRLTQVGVTCPLECRKLAYISFVWPTLQNGSVKQDSHYILIGYISSVKKSNSLAFLYIRTLGFTKLLFFIGDKLSSYNTQ